MTEKKDTRDLVADLKNQFLTTIRDEIKVTVNGKIDAIKVHLENQDSVLKEIKTEQNNAKEALNATTMSLQISKTQFWTAITLLLLLGGTIISLSITAIDSKIKEGIVSALSGYDIKVIK